MSALKIPCPKCQAELKLPNRSLLGKKGKCPKCEHRFVLREPETDEVELELAEASAPAGIAVGQAARWVPDESPAASPAQAAPAPEIPDFSTAGPAATSTGVDRLKEIRRKNAQRRKWTIIAGAVTAVIAFAGYWGYTEFGPKTVADTDKAPETNQAWEDEKRSLEQTAADADAVSPTKGGPLSLAYMPSGTRLVVHLRPAELWSDEWRFQELRACLGPIAGWIEQSLTEQCLYPPAEIKQVTFCWILGGRGSEPVLSTLVEMREPIKKSEWLQKSSGIRSDDYRIPVYFSNEQVYLLSDDQKVFARGPSSLVDEMVEAAQFPNPTATGIEEILNETDSDRHVTVVFQPADLEIHMENLVAENVRPVMLGLLDWFGADVESAAWSMHFGSDMFSEIVMRNSTVSTPARLQRTMRRQLDVLPEEMYASIVKMNPTEIGKRKLIGRFPAMLNAVRHGTRAGIGSRYVQLTTVLDERAAPNLAIGTLLAWDESTRTDFTRDVNVASANQPGDKPKSISERLAKKIDIDFRRTPLQEAIDYIATETGVPFEINGDALKLSGYTKNMPQTFNMGMASGVDALKKILSGYDKMCVVYDEKNNQAILTTIPVAQAEGLKPNLP